MTPNQIKRLFPNASAALLRANGVQPQDAAPAAKMPPGATVGQIQVSKKHDPLSFRSVGVIHGMTTDEAKLNKTERAFLAGLRCGLCPFQGHMAWAQIYVQAVTMKLADDCRLTVDFVCVDQKGQQDFIDVKGFQREDALIKMKVAARLFPHYTFWIVKKDKASTTGWNWKRVNP